MLIYFAIMIFHNVYLYNQQKLTDFAYYLFIEKPPAFLKTTFRKSLY